MTVRQDCRDACITLLNTARPSDVPEAGKRRFAPGERITDPRIAVFFGEEQTAQPGGSRSPIAARSLIMAVQAIVAVETPAEADDACETLLAWIVEQLGNTALGGLATNVRELGTLWQQGGDATSLFYLVATTRWQVDFQTLRADLTRKQ